MHKDKLFKDAMASLEHT